MMFQQAILITPLQNAVLIGSVLGDMHIHQASTDSQRCRLRFCHSKRQKDYVDWKHTQYKESFCNTTKPPWEDPKTNGYLFYTAYRDEFIPYHKTWYKPIDGGIKKIVPDNIEDLLVDPVSLAVWYLDDGTKRKGYNGCRLATQSFSKEEVERLRDCLKTNFNLDAKIDEWNPTQRPGPTYGLAFPSSPSGYQGLKLLIYDFVRDQVPTMLYKLQ